MQESLLLDGVGLLEVLYYHLKYPSLQNHLLLALLLLQSKVGKFPKYGPRGSN